MVNSILWNDLSPVRGLINNVSHMWRLSQSSIVLFCLKGLTLAHAVRFKLSDI
jgi:hypothetical protein